MKNKKDIEWAILSNQELTKEQSERMILAPTFCLQAFIVVLSFSIRNLVTSVKMYSNHLNYLDFLKILINTYKILLNRTLHYLKTQ